MLVDVFRASGLEVLTLLIVVQARSRGEELFFSQVHLHGGPAPVRRSLPELVDLIWQRAIDPGKVFDLTLPLEQAPEAYRAMDQRRAIKALLTP